MIEGGINNLYHLITLGGRAQEEVWNEAKGIYEYTGGDMTILFLLYGYYRAVNQPQMSVVLTIASLGTRVALAYLLSATPLGVTGIWLSVPIGWALADAIGIGYYLKKKR